MIENENVNAHVRESVVSETTTEEPQHRSSSSKMKMMKRMLVDSCLQTVLM